jgi:hypothetical protein
VISPDEVSDARGVAHPFEGEREAAGHDAAEPTHVDEAGDVVAGRQAADAERDGLREPQAVQIDAEVRLHGTSSRFIPATSWPPGTSGGVPIIRCSSPIQRSQRIRAGVEDWPIDARSQVVVARAVLADHWN